MKKFVLLVSLVSLIALPGLAETSQKAKVKRAGRSTVRVAKGAAVVGRGATGMVLELVGEVADGVEVAAIGLDDGTGVDNGEYFGVIHKVFHGFRVLVVKAEDLVDRATGAVAGQPNVKKADGNPTCPPNRKCNPRFPEGE